MRDGLNTLLDALDAAPADVTAFVRDDDAGWDDDALFALLDVMAETGTPIDLAVIPFELHDALVDALCARRDGGAAIGLHQHGARHANHEAEGRKCEFGLSRGPHAQRADLAEGRTRLLQAFGERLDAIFTPPWNRVAPHTPALLSELRFAALSRDRGAPPQPALPELPVDLDWSRHYREGGAAAVAAAFAKTLAARAGDRRPFGLMLHHAAMDAAERATLRHWLTELSRHPKLHWRPMRALLPAAAP
jgi:hypothetical protein